MHAEALMQAKFAKNAEARDIFNTVAGMKVGERYRVEAEVMHAAFPMHPLFEERLPEEQFLEKMIGANYGAWTCAADRVFGYYLIGHHDIGDKRVREDWDDCR